jgi:hypothetical protein
MKKCAASFWRFCTDGDSMLISGDSNHVQHVHWIFALYSIVYGASIGVYAVCWSLYILEARTLTQLGFKYAHQGCRRERPANR